MSLRGRTLLLLVSIGCAVPIAVPAVETAVTAPAPASGFVATLSTEDRVAAGVEKLTAEQQTELNNYVAREAALARAGNVRGFAGTFVGRRNPAEQVAAGLDRLTDAERAKLNDLVAGVLASGANLTAGTPQLTKEQVTQQRDRLQIHGEISFTYGWQKGGGDFKGGSLAVSAYDPNTGIELGVGYAQYQGDGWYGYGPGYPGYYYSARNPYSFAPGGVGCVRHP